MRWGKRPCPHEFRGICTEANMSTILGYLIGHVPGRVGGAVFARGVAAHCIRPPKKRHVDVSFDKRWSRINLLEPQLETSMRLKLWHLQLYRRMYLCCHLGQRGGHPPHQTRTRMKQLASSCPKIKVFEPAKTTGGSENMGGSLT